MPSTSWNRRFFASSRGRIVLLLRRAGCTVDELAHKLKLTDNAVRAHLATLERDGLVRQNGERRSGSKPAVVYNLTPETEQSFSHAYAIVLQHVLDVLAVCTPTEKQQEIMQNAGQRLAAKWSASTGDIRARLQQAVAILNELGGLAELEEHDNTYVIQSYSCPLAAVVPDHPELCHLARTLLTSLVGAPLEEHCERDQVVRCRFTLDNRSCTALKE